MLLIYGMKISSSTKVIQINGMKEDWKVWFSYSFRGEMPFILLHISVWRDL